MGRRAHRFDTGSPPGNAASALPGSEHSGNGSGWTTVIAPRHRRFEFGLRELWAARELIWLFVWRDFVTLYKQTILGPFWYLIQPLATTIVFTVVFGRIAQLPTAGASPFLFYLANTVVWGYFAACLLKTSNTFTANAALFGKVYFPRLTVPISVVISSIVAFGVQLVLLLAFIVYFVLTGSDVRISAWLLLTPVFIVIMACLGLGLGLVVSAATTRYRDLQQLVPFGVQLLMYLSPVVYPLSSTTGRVRLLLELNPMTSVIEGFRFAYLGAGVLSAPLITYTVIVAVVTLSFGIVVFRRVERRFIDSV